jgi:Glyoxalase/Bleomycin resistance protein/Dioxygenase superfamily
MERFIADLVKDFESGKLNRRQFCETIALAATVYAAGEAAANAAPSNGFKMLAVNHISYRSQNYAAARDWYMKIVGMQNVPSKDNGKDRAHLTYGPPMGTGGGYFISRSGPPGNPPGQPVQAVVDHVCYTIPRFDDAKVAEFLKANNVTTVGGRKGTVTVLDPNNYPVQLASQEAENPFI